MGTGEMEEWLVEVAQASLPPTADFLASQRSQLPPLSGRLFPLHLLKLSGLPTYAPRQVPPLKWTSLLSRGVFLRQSAEKIPLSSEVCRETGSAHGSPRALWVGESLSGTDENTGSPRLAVGYSPPLNSDKLVFLFLIFAITRKTELQYDYHGTFSP